MLTLHIKITKMNYHTFFDKFSVFQEGVLQNICTVTERVDKMEASTLEVFTDQGSSQLEALAEHISEI